MARKSTVRFIPWDESDIHTACVLLMPYYTHSPHITHVSLCTALYTHPRHITHVALCTALYTHASHIKRVTVLVSPSIPGNNVKLLAARTLGWHCSSLTPPWHQWDSEVPAATEDTPQLALQLPHTSLASVGQ